MTKVILIALTILLFSLTTINAQLQKSGDGNSILRNADLSNWVVNLSEGEINQVTGKADYNSEIKLSGNTIHTLWMTDSTSSLRSIYYRRSTDNGKTWQPKILLGTDDYLNINTYERMAVIGNTVHIFVAGYGTSQPPWNGKLHYYRSIDGGESFEPVRTIVSTEAAHHVYDTRIEVSGNTIYVCYRYQRNWTTESMGVLLKSTNNGTTFTESNIYNAFGNPRPPDYYSIVDMKSNGEHLYVLYYLPVYYYGLRSGHLYFAASSNGGVTFNNQTISIPSQSGTHLTYPPFDYHYKPKIDAVGSNVYVVWGGVDEENVKGIFFRRSMDYGVTFEDAKYLSKPELDQNSIQFGQELITAKGNYVYILILQKDGTINLKRSTNSGESFQAIQQITAPVYYYYTLYGGWWPLMKTDDYDATGMKLYVFATAPKYFYSSDGGATFQGPALLGPHFSWRTADRPQFVVDPSGTLHYVVEGVCTWYSTGVFGDKDIFYQAFNPISPQSSNFNKSLQLQTILNPGNGTGIERFDNMQIPASSDINFTNAMTIEAWIKPDRGANQESYFVKKVETHTNGTWRPYQLGQWRNGNIEASISTTNGNFVIGGGTPLQNGQWYHVAMTYDANAGANNFKAYVNGTMVTSTTATGNLKTGKGTCFIGGDNSYRYNGVTIDELRFWNRALTEAEIRANMNRELVGNEFGLTAYYNFNDTQKDITGRGNDGIFMYRESFVLDIPTAVDDDNSTPYDYVLYQNYPNPFNPTTTISFSIPTKSLVTLKVFDALGREVTTLVNEELPAGNHKYQFNAVNIPSGVYFYQLRAGSFVETKKLVLVR